LLDISDTRSVPLIPLRGCNVRNMNAEKAEGLSSELQRALEPLLSAIAEL